jgi:hypothetical protein
MPLPLHHLTQQAHDGSHQLIQVSRPGLFKLGVPIPKGVTGGSPRGSETVVNNKFFWLSFSISNTSLKMIKNNIILLNNSLITHIIIRLIKTYKRIFYISTFFLIS